MLSEYEVIVRLRAAIQAAGSQIAFAQQHHISQQYISDVLSNRRKPGQKILDALGVEQVVTYREKR
jgi:hypothetical protein